MSKESVAVKKVSGVILGAKRTVMKNARIILAIVLMAAISSFGQFKVDDEWPTPIQKKFAKFMEETPDTVLIYYMYGGPWTSLPDSCKNIFDFWVMWSKNGQYFAQELPCVENETLKIISISSVPFNYLREHLTELKSKSKRVIPKKGKQIEFIPPVVTDGCKETVVFMTHRTNYTIELAEYQRTDAWRKYDFPRITTSIEIIDTICNELNVK